MAKVFEINIDVGGEKASVRGNKTAKNADKSVTSDKQMGTGKMSVDPSGKLGSTNGR